MIESFGRGDCQKTYFLHKNRETIAPCRASMLKRPESAVIAVFEVRSGERHARQPCRAVGS